MFKGRADGTRSARAIQVIETKAEKVARENGWERASWDAYLPRSWNTPNFKLKAFGAPPFSQKKLLTLASSKKNLDFIRISYTQNRWYRLPQFERICPDLNFSIRVYAVIHICVFTVLFIWWRYKEGWSWRLWKAPVCTESAQDCHGRQESSDNGCWPAGRFDQDTGPSQAVWAAIDTGQCDERCDWRHSAWWTSGNQASSGGLWFCAGEPISDCRRNRTGEYYELWNGAAAVCGQR